MTSNKYIALCGYPSSGKTEAQKALTALGIIPIDDGRVLRDMAIRMFPELTEWHVSTEEGKKSKITVCGSEWVVRDILGTIGVMLEKTFGENVIPEIAINSIEKEGVYSFGSVRKSQASKYKESGDCLVIEFVRDGCAANYEFDEYDRSQVTHKIVNDGTISDLKEKVSRLARTFIHGV